MKSKKVKELETEISELKEKLSKVEKLNQFLAKYFTKKDKYPVMFSRNAYWSFDGCVNCTNITYTYGDFVRDFNAQDLGPIDKIKILRNTYDYCVFECADKTKWILSKDRGTVFKLPDDTVFAKDLKIAEDTTIKLSIENGIVNIGVDRGEVKL